MKITKFENYVLFFLAIYLNQLFIPSFLSLFAAGVTKCPNHVPLYQAWACLEIRGENYEKAKTLISEALTRDKSEGSGWLVAAKIEEHLGNEGLMIMILRRGLECAPNSAELYCAVAEYEVKRGKIDLVCFI